MITSPPRLRPGVRATVDGAEILVGGPGLGAPHWGMRVATPHTAR